MRGRSSGKDVAMTLKNSSQETLLNWFVNSKKIADVLVICGIVEADQ